MSPCTQLVATSIYTDCMLNLLSSWLPDLFVQVHCRASIAFKHTGVKKFSLPHRLDLWWTSSCLSKLCQHDPPVLAFPWQYFKQYPGRRVWSVWLQVTSVLVMGPAAWMNNRKLFSRLCLPSHWDHELLIIQVGHMISLCQISEEAQSLYSVSLTALSDEHCGAAMKTINSGNMIQ